MLSSEDTKGLTLLCLPLMLTFTGTGIFLSPVVQKPINANPRLKLINQENYFSTPKRCLKLIFGKTLQLEELKPGKQI